MACNNVGVKRRRWWIEGCGLGWEIDWRYGVFGCVVLWFTMFGYGSWQDWFGISLTSWCERECWHSNAHVGGGFGRGDRVNCLDYL